MRYEKTVTLANEKSHNRIIFPEKLFDGNIVGIYKFFKCKEREKFCFYIGKSTNVALRLFGASGGHIYMYAHDNCTLLVPKKINEYLNEDKKIHIEIEIEEIDYKDTKFTRAAHRLALAELQEIVQYQKMGQCLFQMPDGVGEYEKKFWEKNYMKPTSENLLSEE